MVKSSNEIDNMLFVVTEIIDSSNSATANYLIKFQLSLF